MNKKLLLITLSILLASCTHDAKKKLGVIQTVPDEYQVNSSRPLEVPPSFDLPKPKEPEKKPQVKTENNLKKKKKKRSWWPWSRKKEEKNQIEQDNQVKKEAKSKQKKRSWWPWKRKKAADKS